MQARHKHKGHKYLAKYTLTKREELTSESSPPFIHLFVMENVKETVRSKDRLNKKNEH